jgi:hypothetical protein
LVDLNLFDSICINFISFGLLFSLAREKEGSCHSLKSLKRLAQQIRLHG